MEFVEAPGFTRRLQDYLNEDQYRKLQSRMAADPEMGDPMPGTGGFRKMRWVDARRGKGQRGGLRIIYYYFAMDQQIWLMTPYDKDEAVDLTAGEKKILKNAVQAELKARASRRATRTRAGRIQ